MVGKAHGSIVQVEYESAHCSPSTREMHVAMFCSGVTKHKARWHHEDG